ncbi:MAG: hypothetical protein HY758_00275 [Nitrospirae bacterium]|nr:hypothetical protein [Nitrospirota bacterium]
MIVGRNHEENEVLLSLAGPDDHILRAEGVGSPVTLIEGAVTDEAVHLAASLCARYSDGKNFSEVSVSVSIKNESYNLKVKPANNEIIAMFMIEKNASLPVIT